MFIRIESKIHVIIRVFLGAMVLLTAVSFLSSSLCSQKWERAGHGPMAGLWGRMKIEILDLSTSQKCSVVAYNDL